MNTLCYLFIYLFEQFVSFIYFNNKFSKKIHFKKIIVLYAISFCIQFSFNLINSPIINLISFFICNMIILKLSYVANIKNILFSVTLLVGLMLSTELLVMYSYAAINKIQLLSYENNAYSMLFQTITTKTLYFLSVYYLSKFSAKQNRIKNPGDFSLLFLPITSISTALIFNYIIAKTNLSHNIYVAFSIISFVLLFSNVFVFLIHEKIIQTLRQNAEYQLEIQKTEINQEYYCELERQYETSNILIHDIKKHLTVIKSLAEDEDLIGIKKYIDSVYEGNNVKSLKQFSNNKLINVIISRYYNLCNQNNISLSVDIRNIDFSFISDSDLTALLNNLLENSYEAARESKHKVIDVTISKKNEQFISFYIINSCDTLPQRDGHMFSTSKEDKAHHGFGIKSIIRVANKYYGRADFKYDNTNKKFISSVLLKV